MSNSEEPKTFHISDIKGLRLFTDIIINIDTASCKDLVSSTGRQLVIWKKKVIKHFYFTISAL